MSGPDYLFSASLARVDGVLGSDVQCRQHGRLGWVRTSLVAALIAGHVRSHVIHHGGVSVGGPIITIEKVPSDSIAAKRDRAES